MKSGWVKEPDLDALRPYMVHHEIELGILQNAPDYPDGTSVVDVATWNEFGGGSDGMSPPPRYWLSLAIEKDEAFYQKQFTNALKYTGATRDREIRAIGRVAVELVAGHVESNSTGMLSNEESVQKRKGGDTPMVDTQHLIRSIDFRVKKHDRP